MYLEGESLNPWEDGEGCVGLSVSSEVLLILHDDKVEDFLTISSVWTLVEVSEIWKNIYIETLSVYSKYCIAVVTDSFVNIENC